MATTGSATATRLVGRDRELTFLTDLAGGSAAERVVVVHGEAGIGKTELLRGLTEIGMAAGATVAWGRGHRFGADSSPYLPLLEALRGLEASIDTRLVPEISDLVAALDANQDPIFAASQGEDVAVAPAGRMVRAIGNALRRAARWNPVIVVIDDLQWADPTTLEVLAFLADGQESEQVTVALAYRDEGLPDGHPLHSWLVDLRKATSVRFLPLPRLTFQETADQVVALAGPTALSTATDVYSRSCGNPYLTELLTGTGTTGLGPDRPAPGVDETLRAVLLASWHKLSPTAREVTRAVSTAGRPTPIDTLVRVVASIGVAAPAAESALREGVASGLLVRQSDDDLWFRHPLTAEILDSTWMPSEATRVHLAFAADLEQHPSHAHALADRALHLSAAGETRPAFDLCLQAAALEMDRGSLGEATNLHRRATELWDRLTPEERPADRTPSGLWADLAELLSQLGDFEAAVAAIDRAHQLRDESADPVTAGRVLALRAQVRRYAGLAGAPDLAECEHAVALTSVIAGSLAHVTALAVHSQELRFAGDPRAALDVADLAVAIAPTDDHLARSRALMARLSVKPTPRDIDAVQQAAAASDVNDTVRVRGEVVGLSTQQVGFIQMNAGDWAGCAEQFRLGFEAASRAGATAMAQSLGGYQAMFQIQLGRTREAQETLRVVHASRPTGMCGVVAHAQSLLLAIRADDPERADLHLRWLRELVEAFEDFVGLWTPTVLAEYHLSRGEPRTALEVLRDRVWDHGRFEPLYGDLMLALAARAADEHCQALKDRRDRRHQAAIDETLGTLDEALAERNRIGVGAFALQGNPVSQAAAAAYAAHRASCLDSADVGDLWHVAAQVAAGAGLRYDTASSLVNEATALLRGRDGRRGEAASRLREAHRIAEDVGAVALTSEIEKLARSARLPLDAPRDPPVMPAPPAGLTPRELEVLTRLAAGNTYAEVADSLFVSTKTVSAHVSNMLRKTGTTSRSDLASWGRRQGLADN